MRINFGWGTLSGTVKLDGVNHGPTRNIITHTCELTLKMVQKHARTTFGANDPWGDDLPGKFQVRAINPATHVTQRPVFHRRQRAIMIAKRIKASLDSPSKSLLFLDKDKFQWHGTDGTTNNDGPTMLFILLAKVNPSARIGMPSLKTNLITVALQFQYNVNDMLDYMQQQMIEIKAKQGSHAYFTLNLFQSLMTTNNDEFKAFIVKEMNDWETANVILSDNVTADHLINKVARKFNNMTESNSWKKSKNPSAKIISALATQVSNLEKRLEEHDASAKTALATLDKGQGSGKATLCIPVWRTIKGAMEVTRDRKTWYWCPHHVKEGLFDGLYMPHKECDYEDWAKKKENTCKCN